LALSDFSMTLATASVRRPAEQAKANGRWEAAYEGAANSETPQDFLDALARSPQGRRLFGTLSLNDAKKPETRARRIAKFVEMFQRGENFY